MKRSFVVFLSIISFGCAKHQDIPATPDSLLHKPLVVHDTMPATIDSGNGLIIDAAHMRSEEHQQLLQRFEPADVAHIYRDFRPLRKPHENDKEVQTFLKSHKLSHDELLAILDEGDRLGWSKPR
jgi:hypothetical protein